MRVVNVRINGERLLPNFVYIGRPGPFGNPFVLGVHGDRDRVIAAFEAWARGDEPMRRRIRELPGDAVLGCYCKPLACHGDAIVKLWKEMHR